MKALLFHYQQISKWKKRNIKGFFNITNVSELRLFDLLLINSSNKQTVILIQEFKCNKYMYQYYICITMYTKFGERFFNWI